VYYQKGYGVRELMKEVLAETWKKILLNFLKTD